MSRNVSSLFKRRCCHECGTVVDSGEATVVRGNLTIDRATKQAWWSGKSIQLTRQQFDVLELLVQREGRIVQIWSFFVSVLDEEVDDQIIDVQVSRIRRKFRAVDPSFNQLETARAEGYRWRRDGQSPLCNVAEKSLMS